MCNKKETVIYLVDVKCKYTSCKYNEDEKCLSRQIVIESDHYAAYPICQQYEE